MKYGEMVQAAKQELFATAQSDIFKDEDTRWGTIWSAIDRERTPGGGRSVIAGMTWVALNRSVEGNLDPQVEDPLDTVLNQRINRDDNTVLGVFDISSLGGEAGLPDHLAHRKREILSVESPLRLWQPKEGCTLDDATIAVFALSRQGLLPTEV